MVDPSSPPPSAKKKKRSKAAGDDEPVDFTVKFEIDTKPENADLVVRCAHLNAPDGEWCHTLKLHECKLIRDVKRSFASLVRGSNAEVKEEAFTKAWLRVEGSSVVFLDNHPAFMLVQTLGENAKRTVDIRLDPYPQPSEERPSKSGYVFKQNQTALIKTWQRRFFKLQDKVLRYGHDDKDSLKRMDLRNFSIVDNPDEPLNFTIETPGREYPLRCATEEEKDGWIDELKLLYCCMIDDKDDYQPKETDNSAVHCVTCHAMFSFFKPKHLCTRCNFQFCDNCYDKDAKLCRVDLKRRDEAKEVVASNKEKVQGSDHAPGDGAVDGTMGDDPDVDSLSKVPEGTLEIQIVQALDVMAADHNGLSDPFCVCYFEDMEYKTEVKKETLNPVWNQTFRIETRGEGHCVHIAVFDHDEYSADDFLGMVFIPLHRLDSGRLYDKWYDLQKRPGKYGADDDGVKGKIHLQIRHTFSPLSLLKPVVPHPTKKKKKVSFSPATLVENMERLSSLAGSLKTDWLGVQMEYVMTWKNPPVTLVWMAVYLYMCAYVPAQALLVLPPFLLVFFMVTNFIHYQFFSPRGPQDVDFVPATGPMDDEDSLSDEEVQENFTLEEPEEEEESDLDEEDRKAESGVLGGLARTRRKMRDMQNKIGDMATMGEKFAAIMLWRNPVQSMWFARVLVLATIVLAIMPVRLMLAAGGMAKFTKHLRKRLKAIKAGIDPEKFLRRNSGDIVQNFIARAPYPWDHESNEKNLPVKLQKV